MSNYSSLFLLSLFLIVGSAVVSICETAIFSVSKIKVQTLAEEGNKKAIKLLKVKENMGSTIGTLVLLANLFGIVGSLFVGGMLEPLKKTLESNTIQYFVVNYYEFVYTFFVLLFGEVIPKNAGEKFSLNIALQVGGLISILSFIFKPILNVMEFISHLIVGKSGSIETASEAEVIAMTDLGLESKQIEKGEHEIIQNVFKMNDKTARDIMTPRVQIDSLDSKLSLADQCQTIYDTEHSRLPVIGEDTDDIRGFVLLREVLEELAKGNGKIFPTNEILLHQVVAVRESTKVDQLLLTFQRQRVHVAIVIDEYGGTSGLVTLEDVLEQLVGEIVDETDTVVDLQKEKNEFQRDMEIVG
jgi:CBS domain containing-hemolysin-like protein